MRDGDACFCGMMPNCCLCEDPCLAPGKPRRQNSDKASLVSSCVAMNFIRHLTNFRRSVLGCTSYGARPQARAVNLSQTPRKQVRIGWLLTRSARFAGFAGFAGFHQSTTLARTASIHESAGFAGFAIRLFGEVAKKFDDVAILP